MATTELDQQHVVSDVDKILLALVAPARAEMDQIEAAEAELRRDLAELRRAKNRLAAVIRVAQPSEPKKPKSKRANAYSTVGVSDERLEAVLAVFQSRPTRELSGSEIEPHVSFGTGPIYAALKALEAQERIRFAGTGGKTGKAKLYRLMPNEE